MNTIAYKVNVDDVVERLRALYERKALDRIFAVFEVPSVTLAEFGKEHAEGFCAYPDPRERIAFWDDLLKERMAMEDDSMPSAYPSEFDQGLYAGLLGGGVLHIHGNGRHLLKTACSLKGLKAIYLGNDRGFPLAFEVLDELRGQTGDMPLVALIGFADFKKRLDTHKLGGGVLYFVSEAPDIKTVNKCMEKVRAYRV